MGTKEHARTAGERVKIPLLIKAVLNVINGITGQGPESYIIT
jgi:hypothetical protein